MSGYPTAKEFEAYLELIPKMRATRSYILPNPTNDRITNIRIWIIQRELYFGGI